MNKLPKKKLLVILWTMVLSCSAFAFVDGGAGEKALLTKLVTGQIKELKNQVDQIKEAKATLDTTRRVLDNIKKVEKEYQRLNAFDLESELRSLKRSVKDIVSFGGIKDSKSKQERIDRIFREIDKRVEGSAKDEAKKEAVDLQDQYEALSSAINGYAQEAIESATGEKTTGDQLAGINSATSMMASQMLENRLAEKKQQLKRMTQLLQYKKSDDYFLNYLKDNNSEYK